VPFAVVGSNAVVESQGKKVRGRVYPWGIVEGRWYAVCSVWEGGPGWVYPYQGSRFPGCCCPCMEQSTIVCHIMVVTVDFKRYLKTYLFATSY